MNGNDTTNHWAALRSPGGRAKLCAFLAFIFSFVAVFLMMVGSDPNNPRWVAYVVIFAAPMALLSVAYSIVVVFRNIDKLEANQQPRQPQS